MSRIFLQRKCYVVYVCSKNLKVLEFKHFEMRGFVWQSLEVQIDLEPDYFLH